MGKNQDIITVPIRVGETLREYILCINGGCDIILPDYQSELWVYVKSRLQLVPRGYIPFPPGPQPGYVRIAMPSGRKLSPIYSLDAARILEMNPLFRNYIDEAGQRQVEKFLMKGFKKTFRDFMTGALSCNTGYQIKDAVDRFCEVHCLTMDSITYEMLRKDWYRYRNRSSRGEPSTEVKEQF